MKSAYKEARDDYAEEDFYVMEAWQIWQGILLRINKPTPEILRDLNNKIIDTSNYLKNCIPGFVETIEFNSFSVKIFADVTILSFFLNNGY